MPILFLVHMNDLTDNIMSPNFGCADDFKIICDNPIKLNIDEIISCQKNLTKSKLKAIKGYSIVSLPKYMFERAQVMKDLGVLVSENLSWTADAKKSRKN